MVLRTLLGLFGVVEFVFTRRLVDGAMAWASAEPDPVELEPWVYTVARLEGLVFMVWGLRAWRGASRLARRGREAAPVAAESR